MHTSGCTGCLLNQVLIAVAPTAVAGAQDDDRRKPGQVGRFAAQSC